jgi:hypothetical protein
MQDFLVLDPWLAICLHDIIARNADLSLDVLLTAGEIARAIERGELCTRRILLDKNLLLFLTYLLNKTKANIGGAFLALFENRLRKIDGEDV